MKNQLILTFLLLFAHFSIVQSSSEVEKKTVYLSMPDTFYITEGDRLEIFKHSIIKAINPNNYFLKITTISGIPKGEFYDRVYIYDCKTGDENMTLRFEILDNGYTTVDFKDVEITTVSKKRNPKSTFNVLLIGDSFTSTAAYPNELFRRLHSKGGVPIGDELTNINFIGTTPKDTNVNREGHSGKSWDWFINSSSPFWDGSSINIANYVSTNGYKNIDAVIILLGTNKRNSDTTISTLLDYLVSYNPSIKGLITGKILPTPLGGTGSAGLFYHQTFYGSVENSLAYNRRVENLVNNKHSTNFMFVDILPSFDLIHNMRYADIPANTRNQSTTVKQGTNNVHPAHSGYLQIADILYSAFHYFLLK